MNMHRAGALACALIVTLIGLTSLAPLAASGTPGDAVRSAGCAAGSPASAGLQTLQSRDGQERSRSYLVELPEHYDAARPYRLVFVFHGKNGNARERSIGLRETADAATSTVFVSPQGIQFGEEGIGWDDRAQGYDVPFFDHMLAELSARYCLDAARVFVAGFSWGGDFALLLACVRGEVVRGVVANSTNDEFADNTNFKTYQNYPCPGTRHPAVYFQHAVNSDPAYPAPDFATTSKLFRDLNACPAARGRVLEPRSTAMACVSYQGCASPVTECFFEHRIGHHLPPHWAEDAWAFIASF